MTTRTTTLLQEGVALTRFPEFPPRDDMQNTLHLHHRSIISTLLIHFGSSETTLVHSEAPVAPTLDPWEDYRIPDLIVAFDCDVALVSEQHGYAIDRQGKAPDFVLEVASVSTGVVDYTDKREDYERYGAREYWRYDPSGGEYHDAALAADRLVDGRYEPIEVEWLDADICRGYSEALGLYVCWESGELRFFDPAASEYLQSHQDERGGRLEAESRVDAEARRADREAYRADREAYRAVTEANRADTAERRVAELEAELRRLRGE